MSGGWIRVVAWGVIFLISIYVFQFSKVTVRFFHHSKNTEPHFKYYFSSSHTVGVTKLGSVSPPGAPPPQHMLSGRGRKGWYLMLVPKVAVQLLRVLGLIVAELAFVRFQFIVLFYVLLEALVTGAGEGTLITAENYSLQVFWQFGTAHLNGDDALFCGNKLNGKGKFLLMVT